MPKLTKKPKMTRWWASSSDMLIYPSIFTFPLLPILSIHCWSTTMHPCTDVTTRDRTRTHFIGPISLIWWTHDLWFTCFTSILSIPNVCPPAVWPITNPHTARSGTFYSFTLDEPYACFLVYHSYLTCLYLPFTQKRYRRALTNSLQVSPRIQLSTYALHHTTFTSHHFASHHTAAIPLSLLVSPHLETIPCPQIAPPQSHIGYTLRSPAP